MTVNSLIPILDVATEDNVPGGASLGEQGEKMKKFFMQSRTTPGSEQESLGVLVHNGRLFEYCWEAVTSTHQ